MTRWYCMIAAVFASVGLLVWWHPANNDLITIALTWAAWALIMLTGFIPLGRSGDHLW